MVILLNPTELLIDLIKCNPIMGIPGQLNPTQGVLDYFKYTFCFG